MSNDIAEKELGAAVLQSIQTGAYPNSEQLASANLSEAALRQVTLGLAGARDKVKDEIKQLSRSAAPDVDGWIRQATKLQADIDTSKTTAREIVETVEQTKSLHNTFHDAEKKHALIQGEVAFNERLEQTLIQIRDTVGRLRDAQNAAAKGDSVSALEQMKAVNGMLRELGPRESSNAVELLQQRSQKLRDDITDVAKSHWSYLIQADRNGSGIDIKENIIIDEEGRSLGLEQVTDLLDELGILDANITQLSRDLDGIIIRPMLTGGPRTSKARVIVSEGSISLAEQDGTVSTVDILDDIGVTASFIRNKVPSKLSVELAEILLPVILQRLIPNWLNTSVPVSVDDIDVLQDLLKRVSSLAESLFSMGWNGVSRLHEWTDQAPTIWLAKRREACLTELRKNVASKIDQVKTAERTETQIISSDSALISSEADGQDEWNTAWEDETDATQPAHPSEPPGVGIDQDEDTSAWEIDEEPNTNGNGSVVQSQSPVESKSEAEADETDAWGWGDENEASQPPSPASNRKPAPQRKVNGHEAQPVLTGQEVTLKETYSITLVPDEIRDMIIQTVKDAETLRQSAQSSSPIAPAALGLYSLPALILAGYRALAPMYYQALPGGNMYLYNDCVRLSSELASFNGDQAARDKKSQYTESTYPTTRMKLNGEISAIESFGRRAYGMEMDSQRTILRDLLDGAQGFANCTESPFKGECENAVAMTSDRLREVSRQWSSILSRSALLQSVGSLLNTVLNKMIVDIEDISDIGAEESTQLRAFFNEISKLSDLFMQQSPDGEQSDTVHVYTPDWFKFQYLSEILDSSLVDIASLWEDGSLKMDFEANEVVDLIEALFAESNHRKNAIRRIRAG